MLAEGVNARISHCIIFYSANFFSQHFSGFEPVTIPLKYNPAQPRNGTHCPIVLKFDMLVHYGLRKLSRRDVLQEACNASRDAQMLKNLKMV